MAYTFLQIWFYFGSLLRFQRSVCFLNTALEHDVLFLEVWYLLVIYVYKMDECLNKTFARDDKIFKGMVAETREEN